MDKRLLTFYLLAAPIVIAYFAYSMYVQKKYPKPDQTISTPTPSAQAPASEPASVPAAPSELHPAKGEGSAPSQTKAVEPRPEVQLATVDTKSYHIRFSPVGAVPVDWQIVNPKYAIKHREKPLADETENGTVELIDPDLNPKGLPRPMEIVLKEFQARFYNELNSQTYEAVMGPENAESVSVQFTSPPGESGLRLIKTYQIPREGYLSKLTLKFVNEGKSKLTFNNEGQGLGLTLGPGLGLPPSEEAGPGAKRYSYTTAFYKTPDKLIAARVRKPGETDVYAGPRIDWAGLHSRYFMMSYSPDEKTSASMAGKVFGAAKARIDSELVSSGIVAEASASFYPRLEVYSPVFTVSPNESVEFSYDIFAGPKHKETLRATKPGLEEIMFYDSWWWMRQLCFFLLKLLGWFSATTKSYGVAIIFLVILIRIATFPITQIGLKQQAKMMSEQAKLKPYLDKINEKYKDNPQKKQMETMQLYREHGVNPLGGLKGCFWMIIQLPILAALYKILNQSIDLRGAQFLWIDDLSQSDRLFSLPFTLPLLAENHFNLLPILTAVTQFYVSKMSMKANPQAADNPTQKQMMYMMPIMMLVFTYSFPAGIWVYWFTTNVWQIVQTKFVNKKYMPPPPPTGGVPVRA